MDDGLVLTPPMGWNSWNAFACDINESLIQETAEMMIRTGMRDAGYRFLNIDDGWMAGTRDRAGRLTGHPERFPSGMGALADHIHGRGLLFGIYEDAGSKTCAGFPGSQGHYAVDAATFASWGVDYLKLDWCYTKRADHPRVLYAAMRDALAATGRPMVFSICCWGVDRPWLWGPDTGHLWRTTGDIVPSWDSVMNILDQQVQLGRYAGPGHWNDPDMLEVGNGGMTVAEERAHFSLWSMLAAPLICGNDLRSMSQATREILLNREVIEIDQDPAGIAGQRISRRSDSEVWARPLAKGDQAVLLLNRGVTSKVIGVTAGTLGLPKADSYVMRDLWSREETTTVNEVAALVPPRSASMFRVRVGDPTEAPAAIILEMDYRVFVPNQSYTVTLTYRRCDGERPDRCELGIRGPAGWQLGPLSSPRLGDDRAIRQQWGVRLPPTAAHGEYELVLFARAYESGRSRVLAETQETVVVTRALEETSGYLSDASWLQAVNGSWTVGYPSVGRDVSASRSPLSIGGSTYEKGLGVHAFSRLWYYLGGMCRQFVAAVGVDDTSHYADKIPFGREGLPTGTTSFEIWIDDHQVYESGVMERGQSAQPVSVSVAGGEVLMLAVTDGGDGTYKDDADWADAHVVFGR
jgi:alpha-galactosidase